MLRRTQHTPELLNFLALRSRKKDTEFRGGQLLLPGDLMWLFEMFGGWRSLSYWMRRHLVFEEKDEGSGALWSVVMCVCIYTYTYINSVKIKVKILPITGHKGPERGKRYSSTLSWHRHLDGGGWPAPRPGRFTPRKDPVPTVQEAG